MASLMTFAIFPGQTVVHTTTGQLGAVLALDERGVLNKINGRALIRWHPDEFGHMQLGSSDFSIKHHPRDSWSNIWWLREFCFPYSDLIRIGMLSDSLVVDLTLAHTGKETLVEYHPRDKWYLRRKAAQTLLDLPVTIIFVERDTVWVRASLLGIDTQGCSHPTVYSAAYTVMCNGDSCDRPHGLHTCGSYTQEFCEQCGELLYDSGDPCIEWQQRLWDAYKDYMSKGASLCTPITLDARLQAILDAPDYETGTQLFRETSFETSVSDLDEDAIRFHILCRDPRFGKYRALS